MILVVALTAELLYWSLDYPPAQEALNVDNYTYSHSNA